MLIIDYTSTDNYAQRESFRTFNIRFHENPFNGSGVAPCTQIAEGMAEEQIHLNALHRCESAEYVAKFCYIYHISDSTYQSSRMENILYYLTTKHAIGASFTFTLNNFRLFTSKS